MFLKAINDYALGMERSLSIFRFGTEPIPRPLPIGAMEKHQRETEAALEAQEA